MKLNISKDLRRLSSDAAAEFVRIANAAIAERGTFKVALSGGSTPKALYEKLVNARLDWDKVLFFFSDERNVPPDSDQSNFRLADEHLFRPLSIDPARIFRWRTESGSPDEIASEYAMRIRAAFLQSVDTEQLDTAVLARSEIRFDLVLLGLGADGHTASLFPHTMALQFTGEAVAANWVPQLDQWRFTFTLPTINAARNVMFLAAGADKAPALKAVLDPDGELEITPARGVSPSDGELLWFVDREAAAELSA